MWSSAFRLGSIYILGDGEDQAGSNGGRVGGRDGKLSLLFLFNF